MSTKPAAGDASRATVDSAAENEPLDSTPLYRPSVVAQSFGRRDFVLRRLLVVADAAGLGVALAIAFTVSGRAQMLDSVLYGAIAIPVWVLVFKLYGLYDRDTKRISHTTVDDMPWLFHAFVIGALLLWIYYRLLPVHKLILVEILTLAIVGIGLTVVLRSLMRGGTRRTLGPERVAFLGDDEMLPPLVSRMRSHPEYGLEPVGQLSLTESAHSPARFGLPMLGRLGEVDFASLVASNRIQRLVLSPRDLSEEALREVMHRCKEVSIKVSVLPQLIDALGPSFVVDNVAGVTLLGVNPPILPRSSRMLKRVLDVVVAAIALLFLAPVMALIAVAIKLDSAGPVLFRQQRIGMCGRRFDVLKFRTMADNAEGQMEQLFSQSEDPHWLKLADDPRITRVGHLLRLASLDELPQLWNVLKGEMSLVGPRPLIASEDSQIDGWARSRLDLSPGITGLWQVLGRTDIPFEEMVKLDYLYVTNWSLWTDIGLMLRTLPAVMKRRGAN